MTYVTKPRRAEVIEYDGTNAEQIMTFAGGPKNAYVLLGALSVQGSGGTWKDLEPGDVVIKDVSDGWTHVASKETFRRVWETEDPYEG